MVFLVLSRFSCTTLSLFFCDVFGARSILLVNKLPQPQEGRGMVRKKLQDRYRHFRQSLGTYPNALIQAEPSNSLPQRMTARRQAAGLPSTTTAPAVVSLLPGAWPGRSPARRRSLGQNAGPPAAWPGTSTTQRKAARTTTTTTNRATLLAVRKASARSLSPPGRRSGCPSPGGRLYIGEERMQDVPLNARDHLSGRFRSSRGGRGRGRR